MCRFFHHPCEVFLFQLHDCMFFFLISNEKTSLGEIFIMDFSNGIGFQQRITVPNMHDEEGVPTNMHRIKAHKVLG